MLNWLRSIAVFAGVMIATHAGAQSADKNRERGAGGAGGAAVLMVNDGGTTKSVPELQREYSGLSEAVASILKRPSLTVVPYTNTKRFDEDLKSDQPTAIFVKTIDIGARAIRDLGYHAVVRIEDPYVASFIMTPEFAKEIETRRAASAPKALPVNLPGGDATLCERLEPLKGRALLLPSKELFTSMLAIATLRSCKMRFDPADAGAGTAASITVAPDVVAVRHIRAQDAVAETIERGWYPVGAVNSSTSKKWKERRFKSQTIGTLTAHPFDGTDTKEAEAKWKARQGHVLADLPAQPNWALMVNGSVTKEQREALANMLLNLNDAQKEKILKPLGIRKFVPATDEEYLKVLVFIGG